MAAVARRNHALHLSLWRQALEIVGVDRLLGVERVGRAVFLQGSLCVTIPFQGNTEVVVRLGIIRVQRQAPAVLLDGLAVLTA